MAVPVTIPKLGLTMTDCTLVEWAKADGDPVAAGDVLCTIETDKIANEIEAEHDGFLQRAAEVDSTHLVGAVIGYLHDSADEALKGAPADPEAPVADPAPEPANASPRAPGDGVREPTSLSLGADTATGRIMISPVARRIAGENGLALDDLAGSGSGPGGVVLKRDVERALAGRADTGTGNAATETRRPLTGMRRTIANRMMQSLQGSAQMTAFARAEMTGTVRLRDALVSREAELGIRVTYTDLLIKAVAAVLTQMPKINAGIVGDDIVTWPEANIGMAVALEDGLVVPVIRRANAKSLVTIAQERRDLADRARSGRLTAQDMAGGTFSVSNFGSYGGDFETPILNSPQSAILGFGQITDEPVVRDGAIVIRPMMMLSMTFDHRLIDGADAGRFRARLKAYLEEPALHLADIP